MSQEMENPEKTQLLKDSEVVGTYAAVISVAEIGLGSVMHSFRLPLTGQSLSLNQGFFLSRMVVKNNQLGAFAQTEASFIISMLKSLAPMGKKLTPMLAISMQGLLHNLGTLILGRNLFGVLLGMTLLSVWSFIQPLILYLLIFGKDFLFMAEYFVKKFSKIASVDVNNIWLFLFGFIAIKVVIGMVIGVLACTLGDSRVEAYQRWLNTHKKHKAKKAKSAVVGAFKDLLNPVFIISLVAMAGFFLFTHKDSAFIFWALMRPVAVAYVLFYFIRVFPLEKLVLYLNKKDKAKLAQTLNVALTKIRNI